MLLLHRLMPYLLRNEKQGRCSSGGVVQPAVRPAIPLRMLAGGSYHDQMMCWRVGRSMTFEVFMDTLRAVLCELKMSGIPLDNEEELCKLANNFRMSRNKSTPLYRCVGALEGIAIAIKKPLDAFIPRNF